jgi:DNA mismatch repair ATPase MutS
MDAPRDEEMLDAAGGAPADVAPQQQAMRVDASVEAALNLLPSNTDSATSFSLYGLLNKAQSPMGKALLKAWIKRPLIDIDAIQQRHDVVEGLAEDAQLRADLRGLHLRGDRILLPGCCLFASCLIRCLLDQRGWQMHSSDLPDKLVRKLRPGPSLASPPIPQRPNFLLFFLPSIIQAGLPDLDKLVRKLEAISQLTNYGHERHLTALSPMSPGLPDLDKLTRKLEGGKTSLQELCQMYRASAKLPQLEEAVRAHEGAHSHLLATKFADPLAEAHAPERLGKFEELLEAAVDMARVPDEYVISPTYDSVGPWKQCCKG